MVLRFFTAFVFSLLTCHGYASLQAECSILSDEIPQEIVRVSRNDFRDHLNRYLNSVFFLNEILLVRDDKSSYLDEIQFTKDESPLQSAQPISVKMLKTRVTHYMREARKGEIFAITYRGKPQVLMQRKRDLSRPIPEFNSVPVKNLRLQWSSLVETVLNSKKAVAVSRGDEPIAWIKPYDPDQEDSAIFVAAGSFRDAIAEFVKLVEVRGQRVVITINQLPVVQLTPPHQ